MSTISDAIKKRRDEEDKPSAETATPRVVQVDVPKDHSARNTFLAAVLGAVVLAGAVIGGYAILGKIGAFDRRPAATPDVTATQETPAVTGTGQETVKETETTEPATAPPTTPKLQGIFPDPIEPSAIINGRRLKLGGEVDGFKLVAVDEDRVVVERGGRRYELVLE